MGIACHVESCGTFATDLLFQQYKNEPHKSPSLVYDANCVLVDLGVMTLGSGTCTYDSSELGLLL